MYSKFYCIIHYLIAMAIALATVAVAHGQAAAPAIQAPAVPATLAAVHGHISDPTGALIPGATITITTETGVAVTKTKSDAAGAYAANNLAPGSYIVAAAFDGFASFASQPIPLTAGQIKRVDIAMAVEAEQQSVTVSDDAPSSMVNVEASGNANSIVLKDKDLDALSDDPDELSNELSALAGPSAGPNGGEVFIDGFSGGQLPPKSAIREIRINQNPFSAEYDRLGYGRIEILTKPGTDKLHGQFFIQGNDKAFNTGNPFTAAIPSYYSYQFNGTLNGAISKTASFFVSAERRNIENVNAWLIPDLVVQDSTGAYNDIGASGVDLLNLRIRDNASARIDWQLGAKNTFTARYGYWDEAEHGDLSAGSLPTASTHESNTDHTVQMSDAIVINDHAVNESRFQFERQNENHYPDSTARTISVQGDFTAGGYTGQVYRDHATRLEYQNLTTMTHGAHAIKFGTRLRDTRDANFTTNNQNGAFSFSPATITAANGPVTYTSGQVYTQMANELRAGKSFNDIVKEGFGPTSLSFTGGPPSAVANVFDIALYAQDDWKVNSRLSVSGGLRWEAQNHIADHDDWAPRVSMAYALDGGKGKQAKTVLRAGYGFFYDRFQVSNLMTIQHTEAQPKFVLTNPTCKVSASSLQAIDLSTGPNGNCQSNDAASKGLAVPVKYQLAPNFHAPYTGQAGLGLERQLRPGMSLTLTYLHSLGAHQLVTRNANQFDDLDLSGGYVYEYYPEAIFKQNQLITSVNAKVSKNLSLTGFYTLGWANSDGGAGSNASNAYHLEYDYGRATFNSRNQVFVMANYSGPWGLRFNPFLIAQSGRPFNITLPTDPANNFFNQRPTVGTSADCTNNPTRYYQTSFGCLDIQPAAGESVVPANLGNGPAAVAVNLRISRGFGFGPETGSAANGMGGGPGGPGGPGGGGGRGGPPGGGLGPGGLGGGGRGPGGMFGPTGTGHKYSLNFSVQALNLFNNIDYGGPNGTLGSPRFDRSTTLAGGIFSTGSAARRVFAQVIFSF